jgi:calmodulin
LTEEEDPEAMRQELREAFRLYDKEGNGYITTDVLKEIFRELDNTINADDLDEMIEEIDSDGSGTVDFEEFMEVMTGE